VSGCKKSEFHLEVFIDDNNESEEAKLKWKTRREKEIKSGEKAMPQCWNRILGDLFKD
jgi:hypothetical protein